MLQQFTRTAFYLVAHADDWQLFMAPEISRDMADKTCKVVIIYTTAGDAGRDEKYWRARETAAIESVLFRLSVDAQLSCETSVVTTSQHNKVFKATANNCISYFLRLPDGAYDGIGFVAFGHQSLEKFRTGIIPQLTSVDDSALYTSWNDLAATIDFIIERELTTPNSIIDQVCLNFPEHDASLNPYDHNDHYNTSLLAKSTAAYEKYTKRAFLDYHIVNMNCHLTGEDLFWKIGMFCSYHQSLFRQYGHSTITEDKSMIPWCFSNSSFRDL